MSKPSDAAFAGPIPELYERHLVPLIFEPYAEDLARRLRGLPLRRVLEISAGTGVVTRALARMLGAEVEIVATDLNPAMLEQAAARDTVRPVRWQPADAQTLPFGDGEFDAVVCQFGVMFFPDRPRAYAEARRVLRPGGRYLFNVWGPLARNGFAEAAHVAAQGLSPKADFLARLPYACHDRARILAELESAGFAGVHGEWLGAVSRAASAQIPALAFCQGTPLRNEVADVAALTAAASREIEQRYGPGPVEAEIQALVVSAQR